MLASTICIQHKNLMGGNFDVFDGFQLTVNNKPVDFFIGLEVTGTLWPTIKYSASVKFTPVKTLH